MFLLSTHLYILYILVSKYSSEFRFSWLLTINQEIFKTASKNVVNGLKIIFLSYLKITDIHRLYSSLKYRGTKAIRIKTKKILSVVSELSLILYGCREGVQGRHEPRKNGLQASCWIPR